MKYALGFIGGGNMASAIIKGLIVSGTLSPHQIIVSVQTEASQKRLEADFGVFTTLDNQGVASASDNIIIAVKPHIVPVVLKEISSCLSSAQTLISIAAGVTLDDLKSLSHHVNWFRAMPNTPAALGYGMTSICYGPETTPQTRETVIRFFESVGKTAVITEAQMHAAIALHGSSPAYAFVMLEAMADAGVLLGMGRKQSYDMAAQSLLGAAHMLLSSGLHPGVLKDQVTSPGGTTIEAIATLEKMGFRGAIIEAMLKCAEKSEKMSNR